MQNTIGSSLLFILNHLSLSLYLLGKPVAPCDDTATTAVGIGSYVSPTIVVGVAATGAWDPVIFEGIIAYESLSPRPKNPPICLRVHHHLLLLVHALANAPMTFLRGVQHSILFKGGPNDMGAIPLGPRVQ